MSALILVARLFIEVVLSCHCARWRLTNDGPRCIDPKPRPSCELVIGWHAYSPGAPTCSIHCGDDS